jgi:hypothetical protein
VLTRRRVPRRVGALSAAVGAIALASVIPAGPAVGQADGTLGYDFYSLSAFGDGVTVDFNLVGFLPIEDLVGLSSITSEAHLGVGRSDSLAALPDPGNLILTLPSTLSALLGVSGLPDYPAAAQADYTNRPVDTVQLVPDAGLGAGRLHTEADTEGSTAEALIGHQVDTVGLLPGFSIGTIRTTASTRRINPATYEATATTAVSDILLLGGLVRISQVTSEVTVGVANDTVKATASKVDVSGVTVAGIPVGITTKGIVGLGQDIALAPVIDALVKPLLDQGIKIRLTPSREEVADRTAVATGGALEIEVPLAVAGYPGTFSLTLGRATADLEVGALAPAEDTGAVDPGTGGGVILDDLPLPGLGSSPDFGSGIPTTPGGTGTAGRPVTTEIVSVPVGRQIEEWDLTTLYRVMLLGGGALLVAGRVVMRTSLRPNRRPTDLRQLWRW